MARSKRKGDGGPRVPGWVVTYGDMMSLLLTFFILLLSFSTISQKEFNEAMSSLQGAFGVLPKYNGLITLIPKPPKKLSDEMERMARQLQREMQVMGKDKDVEVQYDKEGGLKIVMPNQVLFDTAKADLKPEALPMLQAVANLLGELEGVMFEVRGHTDSRPLMSSARFRDNYDLSYGRADAVARWLNSAGRISLEQFEIISCGPSQPVAPNNTEEGMQQNRRVEIFVRGVPDSSKMDELKGRIESINKAGKAQGS
ncbi:MAG TPA: flagellar motor protein MotB [Candidatus Bathyarchaeia archaeon]|nr:flagellar motor protein MotB [Candidatus Bathyarchaeia archaeon]